LKDIGRRNHKIGAKQLAMFLDVRCNKFRMSEEFKNYLRSHREPKHDELVERLAEFFRNEGYSCRIELPVEYRNIQGRIDLVCEKDNDVVIIEVKSAKLINFCLSDLFQLAIYSFLYFHKFIEAHSNLGKELRAYIAYKLLETQASNNIIMLELEINEEFLQFMKNLLDKILDGEKIVTEAFVPGYYCRFCDRDDCPFLGGIING